VAVATVHTTDPWPKRRHHGNRSLHRDFAADARRACKKGGRFQLSTADREYFEWACREVEAGRGWQADLGWSGRDEPTSEFEEKFKKEGRAVYRRAWVAV